MPSDDDGYEPALDSTTTEEASTEAEPVIKRAAAAVASPSATAEMAAKIGEVPDDAGLEQGPRAPRVRSDKNRAMFRDLVAKVQAGEADIGDDLQPMAHEKPPAAATPVVAVAAPAAATPPEPPPPPVAAAAAAPLPAAPRPPPPPPPMDTSAHDAREKQLAAREAAIAAREKQWPARGDLIDKPGATLAAYLRDVYGATDDGDYKDVLTDIVTELSETALGVKLPPEVKTAMESRKALRSLKAYKADMTRQQETLAEQRAAAEKQAVADREAAEVVARERQATAQVAQLLADPATRAAHKFLHDPELVGDASPASIVIEVVKEQLKQGQPANWQTAARYADDYYKAQAEALAKKSARLQSLLAPATPAPAVAPAKAATSPGGVPGPAPTTPTTPALVEWDPSDLPMDRQQRRAQSLAKLVAARKAAAQQA